MDKPPIWNGQGDAEGRIYFTKDNGEIVGRPYVRRRVAVALSKWGRFHGLEHRKAVLAATVDDDAWLRQRNGQTVSSLIRDVEGML